MDIKTYLEESERTAPKFPNGLDVNDSVLETLRYVISEMIKVGNPLDDLKKHIYYKKPFSWIDPVNEIKKETISLPQYEADIIHAVVGIATEAVELLEALYDRLSGKEIDVVNLVEETGDLMWYQALLLRTLNTDFEQTGAINIDKLYKRFPHKFDGDQAIFRDVAKERSLLENRVNRNGEKPASKIITL
jgi:NTP pyrophosphatase (non-canonical NTP hydrolase)